MTVRGDRAVLEVRDRGPGMAPRAGAARLRPVLPGRRRTGSTAGRGWACSSWPRWPAPSGRATVVTAEGRAPRSPWSSRSTVPTPGRGRRHAPEDGAGGPVVGFGTGPATDAPGPTASTRSSPTGPPPEDPGAVVPPTGRPPWEVGLLGMLASIDRGSGPTRSSSSTANPAPGRPGIPVTELLEPEFRVLAPDRIGYGASTGEARGLADNAGPHRRVHRGTRGRPRPPSWPTAGREGPPCCWPPGHRHTVKSLVLVGAACTPDSLNALDRWLTYPGLGDVLTVVGLVGIGEVLPRLRRFTRSPARPLPPAGGHVPARPAGPGGRPWRAGPTPPDLHGRAAGPDRRAARRRRAALGDLESPGGRGLGSVGPGGAVPGPPRPWPGGIPGAELTILARAGHFVARDDPEALAEVIRRAASGRIGAHGRSRTPSRSESRRRSAHRLVGRRPVTGGERDARGQGVEGGGQLEDRSPPARSRGRSPRPPRPRRPVGRRSRSR